MFKRFDYALGTWKLLIENDLRIEIGNIDTQLCYQFESQKFCIIVFQNCVEQFGNALIGQVALRFYMKLKVVLYEIN